MFNLKNIHGQEHLGNIAYFTPFLYIHNRYRHIKVREMEESYREEIYVIFLTQCFPDYHVILIFA